jgi:hypothetical protein
MKTVDSRRNLKGRNDFKNQGTYRKIILKCILNRECEGG